jgi:uncharacterized protein YydD (DUF2326 family)
MFLHRIGSTSDSFNTVALHDGLNLLVADRTEFSQRGDSRNGTGKSSFVRILRYLLGGNLADELKASDLSGHTFTGTLQLPSQDGRALEIVRVSRPVSPSTRVTISSWTAAGQRTELHVDEWKSLLALNVFGLREEESRPTTSQLWSQLVRTSFGKPVKTHPTDTDWETGVRLGYFLGLAPEVLAKAGVVSKLEKQRKAIKGAIREGAISHLSLDHAELRSQVAAARRQRDRVHRDLSQFKVDEQYSEHQKGADSLSGRIQALNDEALGLERRSREIGSVLETEIDHQHDSEMRQRLSRVYSEIGVILPEAVNRRFDEVAKFHASVVRNRKSYLEEESRAVEERLLDIKRERSALDIERSEIMLLLQEKVALETFMDAQRALATLDAKVADLERRLETARSFTKIDSELQVKTADTVASVLTEIEERSANLEGPISLFNELGAEIYSDRAAQLLVSSTPKGILKVEPQVDGDASDGIRGVETFLLDMVCLISGITNGRGPRLLVHDSHLFDAIDHRQVASCLNIGARLAEQYRFQYVVTMNSDFLSSVEKSSDPNETVGAEEMVFDRKPYLTDLVLTDATAAGGLFGFQFS